MIIDYQKNPLVYTHIGDDSLQVKNMFRCYKHLFVWLGIDIMLTGFCKHDYRQLGSKEAENFVIIRVTINCKGKF